MGRTFDRSAWLRAHANRRMPAARPATQLDSHPQHSPFARRGAPVKSKYGLVAAAVCALVAASFSRPAHAQSAPKESEKTDESRGIHVGALAGVGFPRPLA